VDGDDQRAAGVLDRPRLRPGQRLDGVSRYGAYVRDHARLFDPFQDAPDRVTTDPVEFAIAAFRVATGPIMGPGLVRWHPRVCATASSATTSTGGWWCR
jgi:hypothetical protein